MKRVLVVNSQSIYKNNATGITLRSILSIFPEDTVMELYRYKSHDSVEDRFSFTSIQIPPKAMPCNYLVRKMLKLDNYYDQETSGTSIYGKSVMYSIKQRIIITVKALVENSAIIPGKAFLAQIDEFKPEIIYTMGASFYVHKWVLYFANRYCIPVVMHYMDNWRQTSYTQDKKLLWLNKKLNTQVETIEKRMEKGLTISQGMADTYHELYGGRYLPLMNTVDLFEVGYFENDTINLIYAGGLHLKRYQSLLEVENVIRDLKQIKLIIYTSSENRRQYESMFKSDCVEFRDAISHENISSVYAQADILLHIESFDKHVVEFTKYSLSTKIPEYMASGKPIICYAPNEIEAFRYIESSGCGICIDRKEKIIDAICLLKNVVSRETFGCAGRRFASTYHSKEMLRQTICEVLK